MAGDCWRSSPPARTQLSVEVPPSVKFRSSNGLLADDHVFELWIAWVQAVAREGRAEDRNESTGNLVAELGGQLSRTMVWNPVA